MLRRLSAQPSVTFGDVRLHSAAARLLLIYRELEMAAARRRAKLRIKALVNNEVLESVRLGEVVFYVAGVPGLIASVGQPAQPFACGGFTFYNVSKEGPVDEPKEELLKLGPFLKQVCLFYKGIYFTREEVLSYVANKSGGTHFDSKGGNIPSEKFNRFEMVRAAVRMSVSDGGYQYILKSWLKDGPLPYQYAPDELDCVGVSFLGTVRAIVDSPTVQILEAMIHTDLELHR